MPSKDMNAMHAADRRTLEREFFPEQLDSYACKGLMEWLLNEREQALPICLVSLHDEGEDYRCPYAARDFGVKTMRLRNQILGHRHDMRLLVIRMPRPERPGECWLLLIGTEADMQAHVSYVYHTVELDEAGSLVHCRYEGPRRIRLGRLTAEALDRLPARMYHELQRKKDA